MKQKYYVNDSAQSNGDHEVHIENCTYFSRITNKAYLGEYESCMTAVRAAEKIHRKVNGCIFCCLSCHTS